MFSAVNCSKRTSSTPSCGRVLQAAIRRAAAAGAFAVVIGQQQFNGQLAAFPQFGGVGFHLHAGTRWYGATGLDAHALDVHNAESAGAIDAQIRVVAEGGHIDARAANQLQQVAVIFDGDGTAINEYVVVGHDYVL